MRGSAIATPAFAILRNRNLTFTHKVEDRGFTLVVKASFVRVSTSCTRRLPSFSHDLQSNAQWAADSGSDFAHDPLVGKDQVGTPQQGGSATPLRSIPLTTLAR